VITLYPDWTEDATCRDASVAAAIDFYDPSQAEQAKHACRRCPVRRQCLAHALDVAEPYGVWGGLGPTARKALGRRRMRRSCPGCESVSIELLRPHQLCRACGLSWEVVGDELPTRKSVHTAPTAALEQQSA
jgi:WhiB family redox-sensing transcriptional regulator